MSAVNLTNRYALYNFLSTFSGTHYVAPRALTVTLGYHFLDRKWRPGGLSHYALVRQMRSTISQSSPRQVMLDRS